MPDASWVQTSFLGGEWSETAQGRFDDPVYETALNVCLNWLPIESGALTRRPGTAFGGTTRGGALGRVIGFNFKQSAPYTIEFTDGHIRFRSGASLVTSNDSIGIVTVSAANPAVVQTSAAVTWVTGDQGFFSFLGTTSPLLQNRVFKLTKIDTTHFSLADAVTGANIDGATLGWVATGGALINRVLDLASPYVSGLWSSLRAVQTDIPLVQGSTPGDVLLHGSFAPYVLQVTMPPTGTAFATFSLAPANIKDGPYFDPIGNGVLVTPSAVNGLITLTISFTAYDATRAYAIGDYVTSAGVNYKSRVDANLNNTPAISPTQWLAVSAGDALGGGFTGADIGRMVRLFSEPAVWAATTPYATGNLVAYGGEGLAHVGASYWVALSASTGVIPGSDTTHWAIASNVARWTWGKITGLSNIISGSLAGSVNIGDATFFAGLNAAFDGILQKPRVSCAGQETTGAFLANGSTVTLTCYAGKNYTGSGAQAIQQAAVYPSNDFGFLLQAGVPNVWNTSLTINLRAKSTAPASSSDGTLLASTGVGFNTLSPIILVSNDQATTWNYVWIELSGFFEAPQDIFNYTVDDMISQIVFYSPTGTGTATGVTLQVLGDPLLTTNTVRTWRLGLLNATSGYPTVGTYHEDGRLWLSGVVPNRIDSSRSNDPFNMAPTDPDGSVPANAAITYILNSKDINPILWMESDDRGIICGTQGAEWLVSATTQNLPLSPTNIQAHPVTRYGSADIEPRRAGGTLVFVQRFARKLLEYFADVFSGRLTAPNLTRNSLHLTKTFLQEIAFQQELTPTIWARRGDGSLVGWAYKRENLMSSQGPSFIGGHRHTLGSGRTVESIAAGPSVDGNLDALTIVTNDPVTQIRHVEVLTNLWEEGDDPASAWFLDDAVRPTSVTTTNTPAGGAPYGGMTINGLWHLNGATVAVFAAGVDCGNIGDNKNIFTDFVVSNGSIFVPYGDGVSAGTGGGLFTAPLATAAAAAGTLVVGFTYNSDAQVLRSGIQKDSGAANGPGFGKVSRDHQIAVLVSDAAGGNSGGGLQFGAFFDQLKPALFKTADQVLVPEPALFSGVHWALVDSPYSFDEGQLCWRISRPKPATIAAFGGFHHTQDR